MYLLNRENKCLTPIKDIRFSDQNLKERYDLQEWIDKIPSVLGEELLIIQKEFSEFDKTRERLDLLAIDKKGNLVIIENKLDDSGRDVTWQALKYVSYCSSLTREEIIRIYQKYLSEKKQNDENAAYAAERIRDFLDLDASSIDEVSLNAGYNQRIILVAREFRPEVTSTVIWLREKNIDIQCVKVIPYQFEDKIIIDFDKIIPLPETENYMVKLYEKEVEAKNIEIKKNISANICSEYWDKFLSLCHQKKFSLVENRTIGKDCWLAAGSGVSGVIYSFVLLKSEIRIELYISKNSSEESKSIYDYLHNEKQNLEREFGQELKWERLDHRKASRISFSKPFERDNQDEWDNAINWHYEHMKRFENAIKPYLSKIKEN